jgi:hypothetical protein
LDATYLGTENRTQGLNPFIVEPANITVDTSVQKNVGMPVFKANMSLIDNSYGEPYFFADFNNDKTVAWAMNCTNLIPESSYKHF